VLVADNMQYKELNVEHWHYIIHLY